jgi:hypothetical protein
MPAGVDDSVIVANAFGTSARAIALAGMNQCWKMTCKNTPPTKGIIPDA